MTSNLDLLFHGNNARDLDCDTTRDQDGDTNRNQDGEINRDQDGGTIRDQDGDIVGMKMAIPSGIKTVISLGMIRPKIKTVATVHYHSHITNIGRLLEFCRYTRGYR